MEKPNKERAFIIVWCSDGLEWIEDITGQSQKAVWAVLKDEEPKAFTDQLKFAILRARLNPQRHYEIYSVTAIDGIRASDLKEMFESNPQSAAEIIREKGTKIYSDRETTTPVIT